MYLIQDLTPGARAVSVQCLACGKMVQLSNALIDRDGPAFQAYYHFGCAPSREVHERITCEYGTRNRVEKFNPPLLIADPNAAPTTVETISYAEVVDRAMRAIRTRCLDYSLSDIEMVCPSCAADIAALRELARLVERAERAVAEYPHHIPNEHPFTVLLCADLAAGFDPRRGCLTHGRHVDGGAPVLYETCRRCGDKKRRDASCECQLADAERATGVQ